MPKSRTWIAILALAAFPVTANAGAILEDTGAVDRDVRCAPQVAQAITQFDIDPEDVTGYSVLPVKQLREGSNLIIGWEAYLNRKSCPGTTVIQMKRDCEVKGRYGSGGC